MSDPRVPRQAVEAALPATEALEFLERGGQGDAWRAVVDGEPEIVKVLVNASDPRRVEREVETLKKINSEYVMGFIDTGEVAHEGKRYPLIRGEFIDGGSLAKKLEGGTKATTEQALKCGLATARGLEVIHATDLVHRDIKPPNIGLRGGRWDRAVVLDLGLVRDLVGDTITVYPGLIGTVPFMAPEQLRQERAVRRSDIFALGVVLYLSLTGQHPLFAPDEEQLSIDEVLARMESDHWPDWSAAEGSISEELAETLKPMLAFEAYERPRAKRVVAQIEAILEGG